MSASIDAVTPGKATASAVVTGAGSGIGRAIAERLLRLRFPCFLVGRTRSKLNAVQRLAASLGVSAWPLVADFRDPSQVSRVVEQVLDLGSAPVAFLIHCAATMLYSLVESCSVESLHAMLQVNLLAAITLTQGLLPSLRRTKGQVVFLNSSVVQHPCAHSAVYAASKHALKGLADGLREELNASGIRVISVYPGRTATPLQAALCAQEGRPYKACDLMQPGDVAAAVVSALLMPRTAEVTDVHMRPARRPHG